MVATDPPGRDSLLDPDGATEYLTSWKGRIDGMAASTQAMSDRLRDLRVCVTDPNHLVEVTVDASGGLIDLHLHDRIRRVSPEILSRTLLETLRAAKAQVGERSQEIIAETMGPGSPSGRAVAERLDRWPGARPASGSWP